MDTKKPLVQKAPKKPAVQSAPCVNVQPEVPQLSAEEEAAAEAKAVGEYLLDRHDAGVDEFRKLIGSMKAVGATEAVATNHPCYDLGLGVFKHNGPKDAKLHKVTPGNGGCPDHYMWSMYTKPFFSQCWKEAGGPEAGCRLVLFENGDGAMADVETLQPIEA